MRAALRRAPAVLLLAAGLAACGESTTRALQDRVVAVTQAANERDADALRAAAEDLVDDVDAQVAAGELSSAEAARLVELARSLQVDADLIDQDVLDAQDARREAEEAQRRAAEEAAARAAAEQAADKAAEEAKRALEEARKAREQAQRAREQAEKAEKAKDEDEREDRKGKGRSDDEKDAQDDG